MAIIAARRRATTAILLLALVASFLLFVPSDANAEAVNTTCSGTPCVRQTTGGASGGSYWQQGLTASQSTAYYMVTSSYAFSIYHYGSQSQYIDWSLCLQYNVALCQTAQINSCAYTHTYPVGCSSSNQPKHYTTSYHLVQMTNGGAQTTGYTSYPNVAGWNNSTQTCWHGNSSCINFITP